MPGRRHRVAGEDEPIRGELHLLGAGFRQAGAGSLLPWQVAGAQTVDKATLSIAYPVDVPTWDPNALSIPNIQNLYQSVFDSPLAENISRRSGPSDDR